MRNNAAKQLLDFGFANYGVYTEEAGKPEPIRTMGGEADFCELSHEGFSAVVEKEKLAKITKRIDLPERARCPIQAGDVLGKIIFECGDEVIGSVDIKAENDIPAIGYFGLFSRILKGFCLEG